MSTSSPPRYSDAVPSTSASGPLLSHPGDAPGVSSRGASLDSDIPDDFKYSGTVSGAHLSVRHAFIRKVYTILGAQLAVSVAIGYFLATNVKASAWVLNHQWAWWVAMLAGMGMLIGALVCNRSYPWNVMFLAGFTVCEAFMVGIITAMLDSKIVVEAVMITIVVFVGLSAFSLQTKYDFSKWGGWLSAILWGMIGTGLCMMLFPASKGVELVYSCVGAGLFSCYIMFDTQMIMERYHPEDEIAAAIALYLDIVNLFIYILRILEQTNDS